MATGVRPLAALAVSVVLAGAGTPASQARVVWVLDGDTVELDTGVRVRYLGIDAPELRRRVGGRWVEVPDPWSREAAALNRSLVLHQSVEIEGDQERLDPYGRTLAYVYTHPPPTEDGGAARLFVNEALVEAGLAFVSVIPPNLKRLEPLLAAQERAKAGRVGLWVGLDAPPVPPASAAQAVGRVVTVEGVIQRVRRGRRGVVLEFEGGGEPGFAGTIHEGALASFAARRVDPVTAYTGRSARVYGLVENEPHPRIVIHSPAQIEIQP